MVETPVETCSSLAAALRERGLRRDAGIAWVPHGARRQSDFGAGTSSHSSRLIHGGIRYLEQGAFQPGLRGEPRTGVAAQDRAASGAAARVPLSRLSRRPVAAWKLRAGMWLYDLLSVFRNVRWHRWLRAKKVRRVEPGLRDRGLIGALCTTTLRRTTRAWSSRLCAAPSVPARSAANYVETTALLKPDGRVRGAIVRDVLTGQTASIRANVVVNATGPWSDQLRRLDDPQAAPILRLTKGAHVTVPRRRHRQRARAR